MVCIHVVYAYYDLIKLHTTRTYNIIHYYFVNSLQSTLVVYYSLVARTSVRRSYENSY